MAPAFNTMSCPNLAVPAEVMRHVADVESGNNPFAIGVVNGRLEHQPNSLDEAVATARMLEAGGYNYSLGLAQVNRANLVRYGLDTYAKAFDGCANLVAGSHILAECYGRSNLDWGKALSCYYSGDFVTGYRDGYVKRVAGSLDAELANTQPIIVYPQTREHPGTEGIPPGDLAVHGNARRVAWRSIPLTSAANALASAVSTPLVPAAGDATPGLQASPSAKRDSAEPSDGPFVPHVSGPDDPTPSAIPSVSPRNDSSPPRSGGSRVHAQQEASDAAFVF